MRFYQKLRFRITICAVLLVTAVALLLTLWIQDLDKEVLRKHAVDAQLDETSLRFREVSAEIQVLRGDAVALANAGPVRGVQWAKQYELHPKKMKTAPPVDHFQKSKDEAESLFTDLLEHRPAYLRVAYYLDRTRPEDAPLVVRNREGLSDRDLPPLRPLADMIERANRRDSDVSFSSVRIWEGGAAARRVAFVQACFPIKFSTAGLESGLVVITVDFEHWMKTLTRSPRHLVFLAGTDGHLLMYPQPGHPASYVLSPHEADTEERRLFTKGWLTNEAGLEKPAFVPTVPVLYRYSPGKAGFGDDDWLAPPDLRFLLLRYRVRIGGDQGRLRRHRGRRLR